MFTTFFKMRTQPFAERIAPENIMKNEHMCQGLARLQYMAAQGTIALITGQTGVGKSALIRLFLADLPPNHYLPIYIYFTHLKAFGLLRLIVTELGEIAKITKERLFLQLKEKLSKINLTVLLIIDEAHLLDSDIITDLRLLVSSALDNAPPLKIILAGQEKLKSQLKRSSHIDFAHRISVYFHLNPLTKVQTEAYIDTQLKYSGVSEKIFDQEVKYMINEYSNGIPRQINNIATACLINASIQKIQKINLNLLNQTMAELQKF
jgi:general secretion pathway protein A